MTNLVSKCGRIDENKELRCLNRNDLKTKTKSLDEKCHFGSDVAVARDEIELRV